MWRKLIGSLVPIPFFLSDLLETLMKNTLIVAALLAVASLGALRVTAEDAEKEVTIKEVMKVAMKEGLCKKVAKGEGSKEDAEKLLALFTAMSKQDPPKGEADSWKEKCDALVAAAQGCVDGKEGAAASLGAAANCKACHGPHKPASN